MLAWPRCPECGGELPLREYWQQAPEPRVGPPFDRPVYALECPSCFVVLKPNYWRGIFARTLGTLLIFGSMFWSIPYLRHTVAAVLVFALTLAVLGVWITQSLSHRAITFRRAEESDRVEFPLGTHIERTRQEARARRKRERQQARAAKHEAAVVRGDFEMLAAPWRCESCGEECPREILVCWKCGASAPEKLLAHHKVWRTEDKPPAPAEQPESADTY